MVKTLFLCRRRADISHERYTELLLGGHVPLALRHHPTMRRYVVNIVEGTLGDAPPLDSIGALWFDSVEDFRQRLYDSPEGEVIIGRDVAGFMGGADAYVTAEHVQRRREASGALGKRTPGVKLIVALTRKTSLDHTSFVRHWLDRHVPLVLEDRNVRAYVTNVVEGPLHGGPPPFDGFAELQFDSRADLDAHVALSRVPEGAIARDLASFLGGVQPYLVSEHVQR